MTMSHIPTSVKVLLCIVGPALLGLALGVFITSFSTEIPLCLEDPQGSATCPMSEQAEIPLCLEDEVTVNAGPRSGSCVPADDATYVGGVGWVAGPGA